MHGVSSEEETWERGRFELGGTEDHLRWKNTSESEIRMLSYQIEGTLPS